MIEYEQIRWLPEQYIIQKIKEFLDEDMPMGDVTTNAIFSITIENSQLTTHDSQLTTFNAITALLQPEEDIIFAGEQLLPFFFEGKCEIDLKCGDGEKVKNGQIIAIIKGRPDIILSHERVLLNLLQRLCGIATLTNKYVEIAKPHGVKILDTRKTTPGLRLFEKYAVTVGGGYNHRLDLSSGILIKDNHIKAAGGIKKAIDLVRANNPSNLKLEVEVENINEIKEALDSGVDGLLLDNMSPETTKEMVKYIRLNAGDDIFIESSGGINIVNLGEYVKTGVNAISSGALTHSVKGANIHLEFSRQSTVVSRQFLM